jgi:O-antigen ligase
MTAVTESIATAPSGRTRTRPQLTVGEWTVVVGAGLLLVVGVPGVSAYFWSPKVAILLVAIIPGLVALGRLVAGRDRAAIAGVAFVAVAGLSTLLSPSPLLSLVGVYVEGTGFLFVASVVGAWALGRGLTRPAARMLGSVVLAAAVVNAVMCWLQMSSAFSGELFARFQGRAPGLLGNPVHTTALLVGAFALAVERARAPVGDVRTARVGAIAMCALFASAVQLSGGRIGLVLLAIVAVRALVGSGWRTAVVVAVVAGAGVLLASSAFTSGSGAASRLADSGGSSFGGRFDRWRMAVPAIGDRPVLGIGPGLYRRATSPHDTVAAAKAFGADAPYEDGHDLVVTYVVTTGLLGLAALATWLALAGFPARGELAWFTVFAGLSLLVQPQFVGLTPVIALALGAAAPGELRPSTRAVRALVVGGVVVGLVAAVLLLRGDHVLDQAVRDASPATAQRAETALPMWPDPATVASRNEELRATERRGGARRAAQLAALAAARRAVIRDPSSPAAWNDVARLAQVVHRTDEAERAYRAALRWNPQSTVALDGLAGILHARGDAAAVTDLCRRFHAVIGPVRCPART